MGRKRITADQAVKRNEIQRTQNIREREYADNTVIVTNMRAYCGIRNADKVSALPVPEYTCVRNTCVVAVGIQDRKL